MNTLNEYLPFFIIEEIDRMKQTAEEIKEEKNIKIIEYAIEHSDMDWDWNAFMTHPKIMEIINMHPDKPWNLWRRILINHGIGRIYRQVQN